MAAGSPALSLWRDAPGYSAQRSAAEQLVFTRELDELVSPACKGRAVQTDFDEEMDVPGDVITGLEEDFPTLTAFWEACLPPALPSAPAAGGSAMDESASSDACAASAPRSTDKWYRHSTWFWTRKAMTADDAGVLGGALHTHEPDVAHSLAMLERLRKSRPALGRARALDVAGGVGRVTRCVLSAHFDKVDITDVAPRLLEKAGATIPASVLGELALSRLSRLTVPEGRAYDLIWIQWCLGYVVDVDLVKVLLGLKAALSAGGVIVVKETAHSKPSAADAGELFWVDAEDLNVVRGPVYWRTVFERAGLRVLREEVQSPWPEDYLAVHMWVCE